MEIAKATLNKKYDKIFNLRNLFENCQHDLEIIKTALDSEQQLKVVLNEYNHFSTFLDIYSLIDFEPVEIYDSRKLRRLVSLFSNKGVHNLQIKKNYRTCI